MNIKINSNKCLLIGFSLLFSACSSKPLSGYGMDVAKSAAQQAQEQMHSAEQANKVDTSQTYLDLITQMQQAGQWYAALAHTEAYEQKFGASANSQLQRADALRNTGQNEPAQALYQSLLSGTSAARAHRGLGLLHASQQHFDLAVQHLEQARQLNPIDASVLSDLAYAHMLNGNLAAAKLPALQAAQLAPGNAKVQLNLALYWLAVDGNEQARQVMASLQQPGAKGQRSPLDQASVEALQAQASMVKQAARLRTELLMRHVPAPQAGHSPQPAQEASRASATTAQDSAPETTTPRTAL